jgi:hypothetical protein
MNEKKLSPTAVADLAHLFPEMPDGKVRFRKVLISVALSTTICSPYALAAPSEKAVQAPAHQSTQLRPATWKAGLVTVTSRKPPSKRPPDDLDRLRNKDKENVHVRGPKKVGKDEILSLNSGNNDITSTGRLEVESGQVFLEPSNGNRIGLKNFGKIIVKGLQNERKGELILRDSDLEGMGEIEVGSGGVLSIEGEGNPTVSGLSITIRDGGELRIENDNVIAKKYDKNGQIHRGQIENQGLINLNGALRIEEGAHVIRNQKGGTFQFVAGELEANDIGNEPGATITISNQKEGEGPEFAKHFKRGVVWNNSKQGVRGIIEWESKALEIGRFKADLPATPNPEGHEEQQIRSFSSDVTIHNVGDIKMFQDALTDEEIRRGPPTMLTEGALWENYSAGIIKGGGIIHGTVLDNGGQFWDPEQHMDQLSVEDQHKFQMLRAANMVTKTALSQGGNNAAADDGTRALPSATMRQITGDLSTSSGIYDMTIDKDHYGQYWTSGSISVGAAICNVYLKCDSSVPFPASTRPIYVYPILKASTNMYDYPTGTPIGFGTITPKVATGATLPCSVTWFRPNPQSSDSEPNVDFHQPDINTVPVPASWTAGPPKTYCIWLPAVP